MGSSEVLNSITTQSINVYYLQVLESTELGDSTAGLMALYNFPDRQLTFSKKKLVAKIKHTSVMIFEVLKLLAFANPSLTRSQLFINSQESV